MIVCTGRPYPGALPWIHRLRLVDPFVCYQGAQARDLAGRLLLDDGVAHVLAMELVRWCRERDLHVQGYRDDRLLVERDRPEARQYAEHAGMEVHVVPDLDRELGPTTPKLVIVAAPGVVERALPVVRELWEGRLHATTSMPSYLEVTSAGADKGRALAYLVEGMGLHASDVVAVGDGRNDISMLTWAGTGVAVATAGADVLAAADRVVPGPGEGGIKQLADSLIAGS